MNDCYESVPDDHGPTLDDRFQYLCVAQNYVKFGEVGRRASAQLLG